MKRYVQYPRVEGKASRQAHADLPAGTWLVDDLNVGAELLFQDGLDEPGGRVHRSA